MDRSVRSLFISDVHLGTPDCKADFLLALLRRTQVDTLYLVGDIVDIEALRQRPWWHDSHTAVLQQLVAMAARGTRVIYIPGNHDAMMRRFAGRSMAGIEIHKQFEHVAADGRRFQVCHGDELDVAGRGRSWLIHLGESLYEFNCRLNRWVNHARSRFDLGYWPLSIEIKQRIGKAMEFIRGFENRAIHRALDLGVDGYICGHIHYASVRGHAGILYMNDGDWVEHCTALCERLHGGFELWQCTHERRLISATPARARQQPEPLPSAA